MLKVKQEIERSNIIYHTQLSKNYDQTQPYFNKENTDQVSQRLKDFSKRTQGRSILDLGCGTGFMLVLAKPYFNELCGIDLTPAMLNLAKSKFKKEKNKLVRLEIGNTESLPFQANYFDVVTANSFLHHLPDVYSTIKEAARVLKKGGIFYSDQDPNYYFWKSMMTVKNVKEISPLLRVEWEAVNQMAEKVRQAEGVKLSNRLIEMAEYQKTNGGFKEETMKRLFKKAGFSKVEYEYFWFWQEGIVMKKLSIEAALYFEEHLRQALPVSRSFFKYVRILATKT